MKKKAKMSRNLVVYTLTLINADDIPVLFSESTVHLNTRRIFTTWSIIENRREGAGAGTPPPPPPCGKRAEGGEGWSGLRRVAYVTINYGD